MFILRQCLRWKDLAENRMTPEQVLRLAVTTYGVVSDYRRNSTEPTPWEKHRFDEPFGAGLAE